MLTAWKICNWENFYVRKTSLKVWYIKILGGTRAGRSQRRNDVLRAGAYGKRVGTWRGNFKLLTWIIRPQLFRPAKLFQKKLRENIFAVFAALFTILQKMAALHLKICPHIGNARVANRRKIISIPLELKLLFAVKNSGCRNWQPVIFLQENILARWKYFQIWMGFWKSKD